MSDPNVRVQSEVEARIEKLEKRVDKYLDSRYDETEQDRRQHCLLAAIDHCKILPGHGDVLKLAKEFHDFVQGK